MNASQTDDVLSFKVAGSSPQQHQTVIMVPVAFVWWRDELWVKKLRFDRPILGNALSRVDTPQIQISSPSHSCTEPNPERRSTLEGLLGVGGYWFKIKTSSSLYPSSKRC